MQRWRCIKCLPCEAEPMSVPSTSSFRQAQRALPYRSFSLKTRLW